MLISLFFIQFKSTNCFLLQFYPVNHRPLRPRRSKVHCCILLEILQMIMNDFFLIKPDENFAECTCIGTINVFFGVCQMKIHVSIHRDKNSYKNAFEFVYLLLNYTSIFHSPLQFTNDRFSSEPIQKWFGI